MIPTAGNIDTLKKQYATRFKDYDHHRVKPSDEFIEADARFISALENENANLKQSIQELQMDRDFWKHRAEELEGNIDWKIKQMESEQLAKVQHDDH